MISKVTQVVYIHGGMTFKKKKEYLLFLKNRPVSINPRPKWRDEYLRKALGKRFKIIYPLMPAADNAKYAEWKIHFEKYIPLLDKEVILIGMSLGASFLAKYLSENKFPKKIRAVFLVATAFDNTLPHEDLVGGFVLKANLSRLDNCSKNVYMLFGKNDDVVPADHALRFAKKLQNAKILILHNVEGHFKQPKFPELVKLIKKLR